MKSIIQTLLVITLISCSPRETNLHRATKLEQQGKLSEAILMYEKHIKDREKEVREDWENPQFYRLIIADLRTSLNDTDGALAEVKRAYDAHVDSKLVLDRVRKIALKIAELGDTDKAVSLLDEYKSIDEVLVDSTIDRIAKEFIIQKK